MENRDKILEQFGEELKVFCNPEYDSAIIGVSHDDRVVYDYNKLVKDIMKNDKCSELVLWNGLILI